MFRGDLRAGRVEPAVDPVSEEVLNLMVEWDS
jgi:hypothetical protein